MNPDEFASMLRSEGFQEVVTVARDAGSMGEHSHSFEAKALIVDGELQILTADGERTYKAGDVFHLQPGVKHSETYGPQGVKYLVGRKS
jgi:quercetin dioxygenase-like cupin family protein